MSKDTLKNLRKAAKVDRVSLFFKDGKVLEGAVLFNEIKQCGKLINVEEEFSVDFSAADIREVKI